MCRSEHVPIPSLSPGGTACSRQKGGSVTQDEQIGSTYNAPTGLKYGAWAVLRTTHMPLLRSYNQDSCHSSKSFRSTEILRLLSVRLIHRRARRGSQRKEQRKKAFSASLCALCGEI